jgi:hypothetical protein
MVTALNRLKFIKEFPSEITKPASVPAGTVVGEVTSI